MKQSLQFFWQTISNDKKPLLTSAGDVNKQPDYQTTLTDSAGVNLETGTNSIEINRGERMAQVKNIMTICSCVSVFTFLIGGGLTLGAWLHTMQDCNGNNSSPCGLIPTDDEGYGAVAQNVTEAVINTVQSSLGFGA